MSVSDTLPTKPPLALRRHGEQRLSVLSYAALGIVFGDIGTSPLYALRESFFGVHAVAPTPGNVLGVLSLIVWALILVVSLKYLIFILRADNDGEGGILALLALLDPWHMRGRRRSGLLIAAGLFGAALLYGDSLITPAISVLSAVEGLETSAHSPHGLVIPITIAVLLGLFVFQRYGTARIATVFAPVMLLWFGVLMLLGVKGILAAPQVLGAISPLHAIRFFLDNGLYGTTVLGAVFLAVTGGEALYADMGHFGRAPIRLAWFGLVLPALLLNYFGQGAQILTGALPGGHPFYDLAPPALRLPLVLLATAATVIASQAVISGAYSLTRQAVQLNQLPRIHIVQTSAHEIGQIYIPTVNWLLMLGTIGLVLGFRSSSALAGAYGIAVSITMVVTTLLAYYLTRRRWRWSMVWALLVVGPLLAVDLAFLGANALKIFNGGWFSLLVGGAIYLLMSTWVRGRDMVQSQHELDAIPVEQFLALVRQEQPSRVPGTALFLTSVANAVPPTLLHHLRRNRVLHQLVVLVTMTTERVPFVSSVLRLRVEHAGDGVWHLYVHYGFMETPNIPNAIAIAEELGLIPGLREQEATYYLGHTIVVPSRRLPGMAQWRERLFAFLARNAMNATAFYRIPAERMVELGMRIDM